MSTTLDRPLRPDSCAARMSQRAEASMTDLQPAGDCQALWLTLPLCTLRATGDGMFEPLSSVDWKGLRTCFARVPALDALDYSIWIAGVDRRCTGPVLICTGRYRSIQMVGTGRYSSRDETR